MKWEERAPIEREMPEVEDSRNMRVAKMKGPKIVSYRWISQYLDDVEKRVSDWSRAEHCHSCKREIVHCVDVAAPDGFIATYGRECAYLALGWEKPNKPRLEKEIARVLAVDREKERARVFWLEQAEKAGEQTREKAILSCRIRNRSDMRPYNGVPEIVLFKRGGNIWYALPRGCEDTCCHLEQAGWDVSAVHE